MTITTRLLLVVASALGLAVATAGPAIAGLWINSFEPLTGR
jgi:hypothetical protein